MSNNINIDYEDYKTIDNHIGYKVGINSPIIAFEKLEEYILSTFKKYLKDANGIMIQFIISEDTSMFKINNFMESFAKYVNSECDIIFSIDTDENLRVEELKVRLMIAGLEKI